MSSSVGLLIHVNTFFCEQTGSLFTSSTVQLLAFSIGLNTTLRLLELLTTSWARAIMSNPASLLMKLNVPCVLWLPTSVLNIM